MLHSSSFALSLGCSAIGLQDNGDSRQLGDRSVISELSQKISHTAALMHASCSAIARNFLPLLCFQHRARFVQQSSGIMVLTTRFELSFCWLELILFPDK